jgi:hypothetical protein
LEQHQSAVFNDAQTNDNRSVMTISSMNTRAMRLSSAKIFTRSKAHEYVTIIVSGNGCDQTSFEFLWEIEALQKFTSSGCG